MKHLKYFKEQHQFDLEEIREVCDTCFAYLYDKGFFVEVTNNKICIVKNNDSDYFYWDEIKDSFLSLMAMIDNIDEVKMYYYQPTQVRTKQKFVVYKSNPSWDSRPLDRLEEILNRDGAYGKRSRISEITIYIK